MCLRAAKRLRCGSAPGLSSRHAGRRGDRSRHGTAVTGSGRVRPPGPCMYGGETVRRDTTPSGPAIEPLLRNSGLQKPRLTGAGPPMTGATANPRSPSPSPWRAPALPDKRDRATPAQMEAVPPQSGRCSTGQGRRYRAADPLLPKDNGPRRRARQRTHRSLSATTPYAVAPEEVCFWEEEPPFASATLRHPLAATANDDR